MRIRSVKPEFWTSEDIASHDWDIRLVFIGLWSYVDDNGVGRDVPKLIVADLFPLDDDPRECLARVSKALDALAVQGQISRYTVDGKPYLHITKWTTHQKIDHPNKPRYPEPTCGNAAPPEDPAHVSRKPRETVAPVTGEQGNRGTGETDTPGRTATAHEHTPDDDTLIPASAVPAPTFADFWAIYPRHENRKRAQEAWDRIVRTVDPNVILAGTRRFADDPNLPAKIHIAHPTTWLNGARWEDDPLPPLLERKRADQPPGIREDGSIDADAVLGKDYWQPPSPPEHLEPGMPGYREWIRQAWAEHHSERTEKAREVLARRSA